MIVGDPRTFAIESEISSAYERLSFRGLGFFVIHLGSMTYGVRSPDATMLACSFDEVGKRLQFRGKHNASFSCEPNAGKIADAIAQSIYGRDDRSQDMFGSSNADFLERVRSNDIVWAPDGDEAFDDGSCVLQFDEGDRVRLIGFKHDEAYRHIPHSLRDIAIDADPFYEILKRWHMAFEAEWIAAPKV